jgi:hypothetical protein
MKRLLATTLGVIGCVSIRAADRPILSCDKAPLLSVFEKQLPDHVLDIEADTPPHITSKLPRFYGGAPFNRTHTSLVCFVLALDASGKAEAAEISYPSGVRLTTRERATLMSTTWSPAVSHGHPVPSLTSISLSSSIR